MSVTNFGATAGQVDADIFFVEETESGDLAWDEIERNALLPDILTGHLGEIGAGSTTFLGPALRLRNRGTEIIELGSNSGTQGLIVVVLKGLASVEGSRLEGPVFAEPTSLESWDQLRTALSLDNNYAAAYVDVQ